MNFRSLTVYAVLILGLQSHATAQKATFEASTNARTIVERQTFEVTFTLKNAEGRDFRAPDFPGLTLISGPAMSMSTTIVNGKMSQSRSYTFTLMGEKTGIYPVGAGQIRVGNTLMRSNQLRIDIVKGEAGVTSDGRQMPSDNEVYLAAEIHGLGDRDSVLYYPGQQVVINYKIYTTVNVHNYNTLKEDPYDEFYFRYVNDPTRRGTLEVVDGVQYRVQTLKSVALFPQQTGSFTIDPLMVNLGVGVQGARPRGLFFSPRTVPKTVSSSPLTLEVVTLPDEAPGGFTGAIGDYRMQVQINRKSLSTDDALVLTLQIQGDGDARRWTAPSLDNLTNQFEVYEPNVLQDKTQDEGGQLVNTKTIEYLLIPKAQGRKQFRVSFAYFQPDSARYMTLRSNPIAINVTQGTNQAGAEFNAVDKQVQTLYPMRATRRAKRATPVFLFTPVYFGLAFLPFLALGVVWRRRQAHLAFDRLGSSEKKRRRAKRVALGHLGEALARMQGGDREYYDAISSALFSYISSKLQIPISSLTKDTISSRMRELQIDDVRQQQVMQIIKHCETVLYAGQAGPEDRAQIYQHTLDLIVDLEEFLA